MTVERGMQPLQLIGFELQELMGHPTSRRLSAICMRSMKTSWRLSKRSARCWAHGIVERMSEDVMKPLSVQPWPPRKRHLDRLVPVIEGREVRFHCVYVAAPESVSRQPSKIGFTNQSSLLARLWTLRSMSQLAGRIELFWAAWLRRESDRAAA